MKQMKRSTGTIIVLIFAIILGFLGYQAALTIMPNTGEKDLKLGLDLAGGVSITYEVVGDTPTDEQMNDTIYKLQQRIENDLGDENNTTEASVYPVGDRRISVEIPGVSDANKLLAALGTPGNLYFISESDADGNKNYTFNSTTGEYELTGELEDLIGTDNIVVSGSGVTAARAGYQSNSTTGAQEPVVSLTLDSDATLAFADATEKAYNAGESIGIYYDGRFISVPKVNEKIGGGQCVIEGMGSYEAAESLASYIRIGGLDIQLTELQSEVVGAQLGSSALDTSIKAAGVGLILVIIFLILVYLLPGLVASLALLMYTSLMILLLLAFDVTLTLPSIAGIILSIGMAVDANVIIFARIREEISSGRSVKAAIDIGFKKAMSAILDGNITTLIAAAVLGFLATGTVRGFAITLAMGVILSMFTALAITRILLNAFLALGAKDAKLYGRAFKIPNIDFVKKKVVFFCISLVIIGVGLGSMAGNSSKGNNALNFSLEFMGGTSTTVAFHEEYTLEELESQLVPLVSEVTGDNDIQTQKVDDGNTVIIKTRSLELAEREELNQALISEYGVDESEISSENIGSTISSEMRSQSIRAIIIAVLCMLIYIWIRFKNIRFGAAAIAALAHDVLVVLAFYAVARLTVGSAFIACMLTVIGYSVNDTIVIFDRIRENYGKGVSRDDKTLKELVNNSVNQTLSRSISTSITTAITVLMLLILGVSTIKEFALPLLCGVIVGTYSSIAIATNLWFLMQRKAKSVDNTPNGGGSKIAKSKKGNKVKATEENQGILV